MVVRQQLTRRHAVGAGLSHGKARTVERMLEPSSKVLECVRVRGAPWNGRRNARREGDENDYAGCRYNAAIP